MGRHRKTDRLLDFETFRAENPGAKVYVFDVDHTLTSRATGLRVIMNGLRKGYVRFSTVATLPFHVLDYWRGSYGVNDIPAAFKDLKGVSRDFLDQWVRRVFDKKLRSDIFPLGEEFVRKAREAGIPCMLSSATFDFIIAVLAEYLGIDTYMSSRMVYKDGICTGDMEGSANFGEGKVQRVVDAVSALGFDLKDVAFFSDSNNDIPLLEKVGYPVVVHADKRLRSFAAEKSWKLWTFSPRKKRGARQS